jgi:acyl carrier protein
MLDKVRGMEGWEDGGIEGVIHAAGVLRDALIRGGGAAAGFDDVWNAKARSAWLLHKHTMKDEIRRFICFSSLAAAIGNIGQTSYGAANAYLDGLMAERVRQGLAGLSIQWPAISGVGMAAAMDKSLASDEWSLRPEDVFVILNGLLVEEMYDFSGTSYIIMTNANIQLLHGHDFKIKSQFHELSLDEGDDDAVYFALKRSLPKSTFKRNSTRKDLKTLKLSKDEVDRRVTDIAELLLGQQNIQHDAMLMAIGLDSLGATEFAKQLSTSFDLKVLPTLLFNYPTISSVTDYLLRQLEGMNVSAKQPHTMLSRQPPSSSEDTDVAIIGMACRYPSDVSSLDGMWEMLSNKVDKTGMVSLKRWDADLVMAKLAETEDKEKFGRIRYGGFLSDDVIEGFQSSLFGISNAEASRMDPAQRILLDVSY